MRRRTALASIASLIPLAGCSGSSSEDTSTPEPADLQVNQFEFEQQEVELREDLSLKVTITNKGEVEGQGELWYSNGTENESIVVDIGGGATRDYLREIESKTVGEKQASVDEISTSNIRDLDYQATARVTPKTLEFGEEWTNLDGYSISASEPILVNSYEVKDGWSGDVETREPENEDLFAFVETFAGNEEGQQSPPPNPSDFYCRVGGELYERSIDPFVKRPDFRGRFEGISLFDTGKIPQGTTKSGYTICEVPNEALNGIEFGWSSRFGGREVVYWK